MGVIVDAHRTSGRTALSNSWMEAPPYVGDPAFQPLRRSFQPDDLVPELIAAGVHCTVTIEAADGLAENEALLANARTHDWISGVVGWVPLAQPSDVDRALDARAGEPTLSASAIWSMSSPIPIGLSAQTCCRGCRFWRPAA